jgi:hypothetical protein
MSQLNQVAEMAENIAAQVAAETENTETTTTAPEAVTEETPTPTEAAPTAPKGKKGKKGQPKTNPDREAFEAAQMEAAERQREIEAKQKELQNCLKELERKKKLSDNRARFIETLDQLEEAEKLINPEDFETKRMKLTLQEISDSGYSRDGFSTSISNSGLILDFIAMLKEKVTQKIEELETELVK